MADCSVTPLGLVGGDRLPGAARPARARPSTNTLAATRPELAHFSGSRNGSGFPILLSRAYSSKCGCSRQRCGEEPMEQTETPGSRFFARLQDVRNSRHASLLLRFVSWNSASAGCHLVVQVEEGLEARTAVTEAQLQPPTALHASRCSCWVGEPGFAFHPIRSMKSPDLVPKGVFQSTGRSLIQYH